jgi:hypothetical protein
MNTRIRQLITLITVLILTACAPAQAPATATLPPTVAPTNTPLPSPTPTDTPIPTATATPLPTPTEVPTATPLPTDTPLPTAVPPTRTPALSKVTLVNNLAKNLKFTLSGPANKSFQVRAHSEYYFEIPPGTYTFKAEAQGFYPTSGSQTFPPGPFTWTWGKARD